MYVLLLTELRSASAKLRLVKLAAAWGVSSYPKNIFIQEVSFIWLEKKVGINQFKSLPKKKPSEASQAVLWSLSAQKPPYWSSTLLPPFPDAKYQLLKLRHAQRAKFLEVFWVNSDTAVLTLTFHRFCFTKHFRKASGGADVRVLVQDHQWNFRVNFSWFFGVFLWSP